DAEKFGLDDHLSLNSSVTYIGVESLNQPSRTLTGQSDFGVQHTPHLNSFYDYTFSWFSDDFSDFQQHFLRVGIQHQLYESVTSGLEVHGGLIHATFSGSALDTDTGGVLATLGYSKRLGTWGHFSLGNSAGY